MLEIRKILRFFSNAIVVRKISSNHLYITFDDGPHAENTELILNLLEKYKQKASFFVVGEEVDKSPEIVKRIYQQGHSLGYHSYSHLHAKESTFRNVWNDLKKAKLLEDKYQVSFNKRYRPPYGALTIPSLIAILLQGWKIYLWSLDSLDSYTDPDSVIIQLSPSNISAGDVILMHDDYKNTPKTLERLLILYKTNNISLDAI